MARNARVLWNWHIGHDSRWLSVYVPFQREDCLPWQVAAGDFWQRGP